MFTPEERERVRVRVLELARADDRITAGALTGSAASGSEDRWSDVDLSFGLADGVDPVEVLDEWTALFERELGALHYWNLEAGSATFRVFLLPSCLEIDVALTPAAEFGALGPDFRVVFGETVEREHVQPPDARFLVGLGWHHVLHARICIERGKPWQAEHWISAVRDHTLTLACLRHGVRTDYAKGVHLLPAEATAGLEEALVHSLDPAELRRALAVATECFLAELRRSDASLAARLELPLHELAAPQG